MADKIKGKGVISGIAVGKILLAGQNLDSFLVNYKPGKLDAEKKKAADITSESVNTHVRNL